MTPRIIAILAGVFGAIAVATGAFGAHGLADRLEPRMLEIWETAARYQMYHALALFGAAWLAHQTQGPGANVAAIAFTMGILIFSGSLYALALSNVKVLGAITPIGGLAFIVGWVAVVVAANDL